MATSCSAIRCNEEKEMSVGTSTSCSASCGSRTGVRTALVDEDLGHFDNLLGHLDILQCEGIDQQLFFHQRHRNIEHWCEDDLLHRVPLGPDAVYLSCL